MDNGMEPRIYNANTDTIPDGAIWVDRNSRFGNPYKLGVDGNLAEVTRLYVNYLLANPALIENIKKNLKGKSLACWCRPSPCHAELLLKLANDPDFKLDDMMRERQRL
jgi:hypothetical protein